ncbi:MAG: hypothetical protein JOZ54_14490 [Acidobacteria bacterium]|nr:hypothetical protein [Acidobacteriota bacterium]
MKRALLLVLLALPLAAQTAPAPPPGCAPTLAYNAGTLQWSVDFVGCNPAPTFTAGDQVTLIIGAAKCTGTVTRYDPAFPPIAAAVTFSVPQACSPTETYAAMTAQLITASSTTNLKMINALNQFAQTLSVGPVTTGDQLGNGNNAATSSQAYQLQYDVTFIKVPPFVPTPNLPFFARLERQFQLSINTTDQEKGFIDDNSITGGLFMPRISAGNLLAQGKIGAQINYERAIHTSDSNFDATATVEGLIPALQSINLMSSATRRGSPLALAFSYGLRRKHAGNTDDNGRMFSGTALYHLFAGDQYQVDLSATTTWNDVDNLPAGTSRTQHNFKAQVWYAPSASSNFKVTTSFSNGSFGPVLAKLRQYFVGVALSNISSSVTTPTTPPK